MNPKPKVILFASGRGTNVRALLEANSTRYEICGIISDSAKAKVRDVASEFKVPFDVVELNNVDSSDNQRAEHEARIIEKCKNADWLVLCGYMRLLSPRFIQAFWNRERGVSRIVNIHPSLLPAFPGLHAYKQAYDFGVVITGVTVHLVDESKDQGPIVAQRSFSISNCKNADEVEARGLKIEHELYVETLEWLVPGNFIVENRAGRKCVCPS